MSLIFSTPFFQLVNGFVVHTPPVHSRDFPDVLHSLQNAPSQSASYSNQGKSFSHFFWYFLLLLLAVRSFDSFLEGSGVLTRGFFVTGTSLSSSLLLLSLLGGTDVDGLLDHPK